MLIWVVNHPANLEKLATCQLSKENVRENEISTLFGLLDIQNTSTARRKAEDVLLMIQVVSWSNSSKIVYIFFEYPQYKTYQKVCQPMYQPREFWKICCVTCQWQQFPTFRLRRWTPLWWVSKRIVPRTSEATFISWDVSIMFFPFLDGSRRAVLSYMRSPEVGCPAFAIMFSKNPQGTLVTRLQDHSKQLNSAGYSISYLKKGLKDV